MKVSLLLPSLLWVGCVAPEEPSDPRTHLAERFLRAHALEFEGAPVRSPDNAPSLPRPAVEDSSEPEAEIQGFLDLEGSTIPLLALLAKDEEALSKAFAEGLDANAFLALVWLRSSEIAAAREEIEARRLRHEQAAHLFDTLLAYERHAVGLDAKVGPAAGTRDPNATHHPYPAILSLTGERVRHDVRAAFFSLRGKVRSHVVRGHRAIAEARFLERRIEITREQIALFERLEPTVRHRVSVNLGSLADLLTVQGETLRLATEIENLVTRATAVRAHLRSLLELDNAQWPAEGDVALPAIEVFELTPSARAELRERALEEHPELRKKRAELSRLRATRRLLELRTLPRPGLDTARIGRGSETALEGREGSFRPSVRIPALPFAGVRETSLREMRARERMMEEELHGLEARTLDALDSAWQEFEEARRFHVLLRDRLVPLARQAYDAVLAAYDGNRARFLDVLQAARRVLDVRLDEARREQETLRAFAALIDSLGADPRFHVEEEEPK